jgi:hypothetical protein
VARLLNMLRHRLDIGHFEQLLESLTFDQLTETFAVLAFFHPPIPDAFDDFFDFVVRLFDLDKGNQQGAHLGTVEDRGLGADQHGAAAVVTDVQGAGHDVDAVHAAGALTVVDQQLAVFIPHAMGRAEVADFFVDVECTPVTSAVGAAVGGEFAADVAGNSFLVDFDVVFPGSDEGDVRAGDGGHAAVGAAVELEFELVGEGRAVKLVLVFLGQGIAEGLGVVAGSIHNGPDPMQSDGVRRLEPEPPRS